MHATNEDKKQILEALIEIVSDISDKEYQQRVWIRGEGPEAADFDETVCIFFQVGDHVVEEYKNFGLTEYQYHLLKEFRDQFEAFADNNNWPPKFIDTPEWARIMNMAKGVLKAFDYKNKC